MATHALFETSSGYAIFEVKLHDVVGALDKAVQASIDDYPKFAKMVSLVSFAPFQNAAHALENMNDISENIINPYLQSVLELNLTKPKKGSSVVLAANPALAVSIAKEMGISIADKDVSLDILRGIRQHASKLLKGLQEEDLTKAQLGLGHAYSRAKLKFNVNRIDNMIIQAIALLDQLDKDVNLFSMRVREWYGYHFPELVKIVPDNYQYARVAQFIGAKESLTEEKLPELAALLEEDTTRAQNILDAARGSMGVALSEFDILNINMFATRVVSLAEYRKSLQAYLHEKMNDVAPSFATAALGRPYRKYPASTVQILGAEKALFRALKTKGNTPKYGLIYHSSFIGRAAPKVKGRISRFLANKCSIAARIDCYTDRALLLRPAINAWIEQMDNGLTGKRKAAATRKKKKVYLSPQDWDQLTVIRDILSALNDVTHLLSVGRLPTLPMILPLYKHLETHFKAHLNKARRQENWTLRTACETALEKLDHYLHIALDSNVTLLAAGAYYQCSMIMSSWCLDSARCPARLPRLDQDC
ncbi:hypothetical protein NUW54_g10707 [Trametes sanguinea]|uniref:Uncharacterized protein n=1 Tax=Trametes sanguinea TaxID=158606 RepID=A0ACC1NUI7_9APHY|nr:hypothetical protein NUW54_g10707 [Trametes sanguinea]